jgi:hypothetical protein
MSDASSPPSFLEALAARLAGRGGGRGVASDLGSGSGAAVGSTLGPAPARRFRITTSPAGDRSYRPASPSGSRGAKGCACDGRRKVPGLRKGR